MRFDENGGNSSDVGCGLGHMSGRSKPLPCNVSWEINNPNLEPFESITQTPSAAQMLHFEGCTYISLVYTVFQELTEWDLQKSHGRLLRCSKEGSTFFGTFFPDGKKVHHTG